MWSKLGALFEAIEQEQFNVLEDPGTLVHIAPGFRHLMAAKLAALPSMERSRLLAFCMKYRGRHLWMTLAKIMLISTLCGLAAALLIPKVGLFIAVIGANMLGMGMVCWFLMIYFSHSMMFGKPIYLVLFMATSGALGTMASVTSIGWQKGMTFQQSIEQQWLVILAFGCAVGLLFSIPVTLMGAIRNRQYKQYTAQLERDAQNHRAARELSESRLRLLHAQIEPHFLFNTLGAVQQLAEKGAPEAARLTAILIAFLRASLAEMRSETVALHADFALIKAYLDVMKARLGTRLDYTLELPASLAHVTIPSMMLLTLVENAIKHGIEPALRGGHISVTGAMQGTNVVLTVRDTGPGLGSEPGAGDGLANVRARLMLRYGDAAALSVADGAEGGVVAAIILPPNSEAI